MSESDAGQYRQRDAASMLILGGFFSLLATLVLIGSFWATGRTHALIVNLAAGGLMLAVGLTMMWIGRRLQTKSPPPSNQDQA